MAGLRSCLLAGVMLASSLPAQAPAAQGLAERGLAVTFAPLDADQRAREGTATVRARLLALHVERGESPTPTLSPGRFSARFTGAVPLPIRDRYRFRAVGKGDVVLEVNGQKVLSGTLRANRPLDSEPVRLKKGDNEIVATLDSTAFGDATLRVSWSSPDFAFEPIAPELWHCADDPALQHGEARRRGQQLFVEDRCARCHQPTRPVGESAFGELDNEAPDLRRAAERMRPDFMARWIADPQALRSDTLMPKLPLADADVADIAAFLATLGKPLPEPQFTQEQAEQGSETFLELGCVACHVPPAEDRDLAKLGDRIHLGFVPQKWHGAALVAFLRAPRDQAPNTRMPDFKLSPVEATALAAYLLQGRPAADAAPKGNAEHGKYLVARVGCVRCHQLGVTDSSSFAALPGLANAGDKGCLGGSGAPDFHLDAAAKADLRAFLPIADTAPFRRVPADYAARAVAAHRCTNCHSRDSAPSVWARVVTEQVAQHHPVVPSIDPVGQGVPALTWVGEKLQPSWLQKFVTGAGTSPRPWLHARMPAFAADGAAIVAGLLREHGYPPQDDPKQPPDPNQAAVGMELVKMGDGFGCVQCHGIGDQKPVQVFEREGINFKFAAQRLRHDYYSRWLLDPPRIDPESKMPKFADAKGKTPHTKYYGGDAVKQFEAIWQFIQTLN